MNIVDVNRLSPVLAQKVKEALSQNKEEIFVAWQETKEFVNIFEKVNYPIEVSGMITVIND